MGSSIFPVSSVGSFAEREPYYPFPVAFEKGILPNPEELARPVDIPPGLALLGGYIPNSKQAGLIDLGTDGVAAFDLAAGELHGRDLMIAPATKHAVTHEGLMQDEGMIIMGTKEGQLRVAAFALNVARNPWLVESLRHRKFRIGTRIGDVAVISAKNLDMPADYEVKDIDATTGILRARPRSRFY
jgi:hypothetical protein